MSQITNRPLPNHVHRFVPLDRPMGRLKSPKALFGFTRRLTAR